MIMPKHCLAMVATIMILLCAAIGSCDDKQDVPAIAINKASPIVSRADGCRFVVTSSTGTSIRLSLRRSASLSSHPRKYSPLRNESNLTQCYLVDALPAAAVASSLYAGINNNCNDDSSISPLVGLKLEDAQLKGYFETTSYTVEPMFGLVNLDDFHVIPLSNPIAVVTGILSEVSPGNYNITLPTGLDSVSFALLPYEPEHIVTSSKYGYLTYNVLPMYYVINLRLRE